MARVYERHKKARPITEPRLCSAPSQRSDTYSAAFAAAFFLACHLLYSSRPRLVPYHARLSECGSVNNRSGATQHRGWCLLMGGVHRGGPPQQPSGEYCTEDHAGSEPQRRSCITAHYIRHSDLHWVKRGWCHRQLRRPCRLSPRLAYG